MTWEERLAVGVDFQFVLILPVIIIAIYIWLILKKHRGRLHDIEAAARLRTAASQVVAATAQARHADWRASRAAELAELRIVTAIATTKNFYMRREVQRLKLANDIRSAKRGHILYRFTDYEDSLIYVGITSDIRRRARQHQETKQWWSDVADVHLEYFQNRTDLANAERRAIVTEHPRENVITYRGSSPCLTT